MVCPRRPEVRFSHVCFCSFCILCCRVVSNCNHISIIRSGSGKKKCWYGILSLLSFIPSLPFLPFLCVPSLSWDPLQIQLEGLWSIVSLPTLYGWSLANSRLMMHYELKITLPLIALLQKFSDNQICIVTYISPATYRCGISQKISGGMVWSLQRKCQYGILFHFQRCFKRVFIDNKFPKKFKKSFCSQKPSSNWFIIIVGLQ